MTGFRGSDGALDREIEATERIARLRVRRAAAEMKDLDRDLRELRRERVRRRAENAAEVTVSEAVSDSASV